MKYNVNGTKRPLITAIRIMSLFYISYYDTYVLLGEWVDQLRKNLIWDDGLGQLVRVVGKTAECECSWLLDAGNVIQQEGSQEGHNTYKLIRYHAQNRGGI